MTSAEPENELPQIDLYRQLCRFFTESRLSPSLLFAGKKGVGKWHVASALAKTITCLDSKDGYCDHCDSCRQNDQFAHPDVFYLFPLPQDEKKSSDAYFPYLTQKRQQPFSSGSDDVKSFITIESIRKFQNGLALRPSLSAHKVGIIYEAERMLPGTMDSLLKTLEEPPQNSILIVVTDRPRLLHPTLLSRLQRVNFPVLDRDFIADYLRRRYSVPDNELGIVSRFAGGSLYNIDTLIDKEFFRQRESAFELFADALKMAAADFEFKYYDSAMIDSRDKVERLIVHWQGFLRDMMIINTCGGTDVAAASDNLINFDYRDRFEKYCGRFSSLALVERQIDRLEQVKSELRRNVNAKMAAFSFLFDLSDARAQA